MKRRTDRLLAAASLLILMLAVVPGMAYTGAWSGTEGDLRVIIAEDAVGAHAAHGQGHDHGTVGQHCRVGPSKCTSQPSFVSTVRLGERVWTPVPPDLSHEIAGPAPYLAFQAPAYRVKPPPRPA
jgi:hypothetical protein